MDPTGPYGTNNNLGSIWIQIVALWVNWDHWPIGTTCPWGIMDPFMDTMWAQIGARGANSRERDFMTSNLSRPLRGGLPKQIPEILSAAEAASLGGGASPPKPPTPGRLVIYRTDFLDTSCSCPFIHRTTTSHHTLQLKLNREPFTNQVEVWCPLGRHLFHMCSYCGRCGPIGNMGPLGPLGATGPLGPCAPWVRWPIGTREPLGPCAP